MKRSHFLALIAACAAAPLALAQAPYPNKAISVIVPVPPGGAADVLARAAMNATASLLGQPIVIDNKSGAGGRLAADILLAEPADGSAVMLVPGGNLTIYPHIYTKLRYNGLKDFAPLATA